MKKKALGFIVILSLVLVLGLVGCTNSNQADSEVKILKEEVVVKAAEGNEQEMVDVAEVKDKIIKEENLEAFQGKVNRMLEKVEKAETVADFSENREKFYELKREMEYLENELELYEEDLESQYYAGKLSKEQYRKMELAVENLEDQLDIADENLEYRFGIDD